MLFLACKQYSEGRWICQAFLIIPFVKKENAGVDISDCRQQAGVCTGPIVHDT